MTTGPSSPLTVSGLTNGQAYTARARARNAAGWGPWSADSSQFKPGLGFRAYRGAGGSDQKVYPNSFAEAYATGTVDSAATSSFQTWLASHPTSVPSLTSQGWSPVPILNEGSISEVPVALVNVNGELISTASDKARALKQGVPLPTDGSFVPQTTSDAPACVYDPNYSIFDATAGLTYYRRVWDLWRVQQAGYYWSVAGGRTADRAVSGLTVTNNSATISFSSGMITQSADAGKTLAGAAAAFFPANTYIISAGTTTAVMSNPATTPGGVTQTGQTGTVTPTNPANLSWPVFECQNASRFLDLDNNPGWPINRYLNQGSTKPTLVEDAIWATTATRLGFLTGMCLDEDCDRYINHGFIPQHCLDLSVPYQNGTFVWPAQATDTSIHFDATVPMAEGQRFRLDFGYGETPGLLMPLTDADIDARSNLHIVAKMYCKVWARNGGAFWDSTNPPSFTNRWEDKMSRWFGATPYYDVLDNIPWNKAVILTVGSDTNWNP